ncbi:hypothetical protein PUN28_000379 [Cardiocondyla obscurior]|uniref:RRM domain-containing protein n=2 Tax=Cardiocondyla obscurior TaxID=286306 RepID=A0AAW2GZ41_9HYME
MLQKNKMGRSKSQKNKDQEAHKLHGIKLGSVKKNKDQKFKNTPTGKVTLVSKSKIQNKNVSMSPQENKNAQKGFKASKNQTVPKQTSKNNAKQGFSTKKQSLNKVEGKSSNGKLIFDPVEALEQFDYSSSDIDEKDHDRTAEESADLSKTDETFEDEESETDGPDIFGESLRDDSDEDDTDFKEENEDFDDDDDSESNDDSDDNDDSNEKKILERKGIKMFKGLRSKGKINDKDQENDDDESDDSEYEDEELEEESDDDDILQKQLNNKNLSQEFSMESDENEDSEDSDEDDEYDDDDDEIGLKTLLGKSIEDDDDDKDYNEEIESDEDDDFSSENEDDEENGNAVIQTKAIANKQVNEAAKNNLSSKVEEKKTPEEIKLEERVVIIENIPKSVTSKQVKNLAKAHGFVEQVHLEPLHVFTIENEEKKAVERKEKLISYTGKVLYKTNESAKTAAQKMHGQVLDGHYLSALTMAEYNGPFNVKKAVFITNLKEDADMNSIWQAFSECGAIKCVELVRKKDTNLCEHGYIHYFNEEDASSAFKSSNRLKVMGQRVVVLRVRSKDEFIFREEKCVFKLNLNDSTASIGLKRSLPSTKDEDKGLKKFKTNSEKSVVCAVNNRCLIS